MKITYFCHELSSDDTAQDEEAIRQFPEVVQRFIPGLRCDVSRLGRDLVETVLQTIEEQADFRGCAKAVCDMLRERLGRASKLVVCCNADWTLARKGKAGAAHASWGCQWGQLVAIYKHDRYVIWHELFHLLGADDCYDVGSAAEIRDHTCGNQKCIMQYAPSEQNVDEPPFICRDIIQRIRTQSGILHGDE